MKYHCGHPLLLQRAGALLAGQWKRSRLPFLSSVLFGFLAYAFAFTNKLINHDEVQCLFAKGATVSSGRWGLGILDAVFPNLSMPWIYGVFSVLFIALAICLIVRILDIRNRLLQVLLAGCVMVFPSLIGTFGYMFTSCSYGLAFLLAITAVALIREERVIYRILALGCMVFSLSIYQSYISVAAGLLVVLLIGMLLRGEETGAVLSRGVRWLLFLIVSLGCYYVATRIFMWLLHVPMGDYAAGNVSFDPLSLPRSILDAYRSFLLYFTEGFQGLLPTRLSRAVHILCLAAVLLLLLLWIRTQKKREPVRLLLLGILLLLLPLAINCMYLFAVPESVHTLVLYGFVSLYALAAVVVDITLPLLCERQPGNPARLLLSNAVTLCLAVVILCNTYIANAAWLNLHLRYENAYSFYSSLTAQIRQMPEFTPDTKLAVLGTWQEPAFYEEHFPFLIELTGVKGFLPDSYSRGKFMEYYLAFPMPVPTEKETAAILASPEYAAMAVYPYYGSVQLIGDTIVVKLSN